MSSQQPNSIEVDGVIEASAFDLDGSVLAVDLVGSSGERYLIADNRHGEYLLRHIGKNVFVEGRVSFEDSIQQLEITKYQMMNRNGEKK